LPKEALPKIEAQIGGCVRRSRDQKILKRAKLNSRAEWDAKLREMGSSVEREKRQFIDNTLGNQWIAPADQDRQGSHAQDMLDYYYAPQHGI